jgi:hypothetical protein
MLALLDPRSGGVPNLGPNDGASIFPFSACPFSDYRPVLQAASASFLGSPAVEPGAWDEMAVWFGAQADISRSLGERIVKSVGAHAGAAPNRGPHVLRAGSSWAYLRAAHFDGRPGHADQLHLDLWWNGLNIALDPGTYMYNALPPWDNALVGAAVHNTLTVEGQDQMTRAGRFLYVGAAQAEALLDPGTLPGVGSILARHDGYRRLGLTHQRQVSVQSGSPDTGEECVTWKVVDSLLPYQQGSWKDLSHSSAWQTTSGGPVKPRQIQVALHWLLPDWPWEILPAQAERGAGLAIRLCSPQGCFHLEIGPAVQGELHESKTLLVRGGEILAGEGEADPTWGWFSPTYNVKLPVLSLRFQARGELPLRLQSLFTLPDASQASGAQPERA